MTGRLLRVAVAVYLTASLAMGVPVYAQGTSQQASQTAAQQSAPAQTTQPARIPYPNLLAGPDYSNGKRIFPNFFAAYSPIKVAAPELTNTPRIYDLIHEGKLELSLDDAIALALENNLDIKVERYVPWQDQANLLNAKGGGTPVGQFTTGGGGGGTFDPVIFSTLSMAATSTPVSNPFISGIGTGAGSGLIALKNHTTTMSVGYGQEFHTGTSFSVQLNNTRSSSSSAANFFNPYVNSNLSVNLQQPLLRGFGILPTTRYIIEGKNNTVIGKMQFKQQVITTISQVETQYWNLVYTRQNVAVQKAALATSQKLYEDNKRQLEIGTLAPLDVLTAESEIATDQQAVIAAQTNVLQQQTVLLNLLTKNLLDPKFENVEVVPTTPIAATPEAPQITLSDAVKEAWSNSPQLRVDQLTLDNDGVEVKATRSGLLPSLTLSANYTSSGLGGNRILTSSTPAGVAANLAQPIVDSTGAAALVNGQPAYVGIEQFTTASTIVPGGVGDAYSSIFQNAFPSYSASLSLNLPLRNRSAEAFNALAQIYQRRDETTYQRDRNTIVVNVRQALVALQQDAAQVAATVKATQLAQQTLTDEQKKYQLGASTSYQVILRSRDLTATKGNELLARVAFQNALVAFNQALSRTLDINHITVAGNRVPTVHFAAPNPQIPGTIDGQLTGADPFAVDLHK